MATQDGCNEATTLEEQLPQPADHPVNTVSADGQAIREALKNHMVTNFPLRQGTNDSNLILKVQTVNK